MCVGVACTCVVCGNDGLALTHGVVVAFTTALELRAGVDLLEHVLQEPAYDALRTKEQLGYHVRVSARLTGCVAGFGITVQVRRAAYVLVSMQATPHIAGGRRASCAGFCSPAACDRRSTPPHMQCSWSRGTPVSTRFHYAGG